jgi:aminoglycoside phosphotransferase (APT) family kinase protein
VPRVTQDGPFAEQRLKLTLAEACRLAGLDPHGAQLIHVTVNAIFRLASAPVVLRIAATRDLVRPVERVVAAARWLEAAQVPAVRLFPALQPIMIDETGHVVTYWTYLPQHGMPLSAGDLAEPLRQLHALPAPTFVLPDWQPIDTARARIEQHAQGVLTAAEHAWFLERAASLDGELSRLEFPLARAIIHGDAYVGNVLRDTSGQAVLCDLDSMCLGPREWDLIPELVGHRRYHRPAAEYQRLVDTYGFDPRDWPAHRVLCDLREFLVLTSVLPVLGSSLGIASEFRLRLNAMRRGDTSAAWTPFGRAA